MLLGISALTITLPDWGCGAENTVGLLRRTSAASEGFTLFTAGEKTYLIDLCGQIIQSWTSDYPAGHAAYLLEDGSLLRACKIPNPYFDNGGLGGRLEKKDWNDSLLWSFPYSDSLKSLHHDILPLPNGNILALALTRKSRREALHAGRKHTALKDSVLYNEQIIEIEPGPEGGEIVWEWNVWDHLVQDGDPTLENYGSAGQNPQLLNINYLGLSGGKANWIHFNSIAYHPDMDLILLASRQLNEIYIIDHSTTTAEAASHSGGRRGRGGDFLYRWGNPEAYDRGQKEDRQLFGPHAPYWIPREFTDGGRIMVFNNGAGRDRLYSSIEIIDPPGGTLGSFAPDPDTGKFGPDTPIWRYGEGRGTSQFFSLLLSNAQRLPNGNTLINEGTNGRFFEVDPQGETVWEYVNPDTPKGLLSQGDAAPTGNHVFKIHRYPSNYKGFEGKQLIPSGFVEKNGNSCPCLYNLERRGIEKF